MEVKITRASDALVCLLYRHYCERIDAGEPRKDAKQFGSAAIIQKDIAPKWTTNDIEEVCGELHRANLLECFYADDTVYCCWLSDQGIIYMENRFKNKLDNLLSYLEKIASILPT